MDDPLIVIGLIAFPWACRWLISSPRRLERIQRSFRDQPDAAYLCGLCLNVALLPLFVVATVTSDIGRGLFANTLYIWCTLWCLLGLVSGIFPIPVPRWLVPKVYRNDTEHVYCRPVIGLKRVETLSRTPEPVTDDADDRQTR